MNETLKTILERRSIRNFKDTMIDEETMQQILLAGTHTPTARNLQTPIIIEITDKEIRKELAKENAKIGGWPEDFDPFYGAPVVLLVIAKNTPTAVYDGSAVVMNLLNAAWSLGVGSCWIHRAKEELESDFGKVLLKKLHIEGDDVGIGHIALGYMDGKIPEMKPRKDNWIYKI